MESDEKSDILQNLDLSKIQTHEQSREKEKGIEEEIDVGRITGSSFERERLFDN